MSECIFCKITKGELPSSKIYEDENVFAFLDISPVNKGHVLVIPKNHHKYMTDTPDEELGFVFTAAKKIMTALKKSLKADFVTLSVIGLDVPHFHVHVIPRFDDDGLANWHPTQEYEEDEIDEYADKIKKHL